MSVFCIIPLMLGIGLGDHYLNDGAWLPHLGLASLFLPLYLLFFELPHIISSFVSFVDKEYVRFYARHLFLGLPLLLAVFSLLLWWNSEVAIVIYLVATTYHVLRPQTGIALMFGVPKDRRHQIWSLLTIIVASVMYLTVVAPHVIGPSFVTTLSYLVVVLLGALCVSSVFVARVSPPGMAQVYILATTFMLVGSYALVEYGYIFLAIFAVRFIHDVTAFLFYITHEMNRNQGTIQNWLYTVLPLVPRSLMVAVPALGIGIGLALRETITDAEALFIVIMILAMVHYYLESIMWKRGSLHRRYVKVV